MLSLSVHSFVDVSAITCSTALLQVKWNEYTWWVTSDLLHWVCLSSISLTSVASGLMNTH